MRLLIASRTEEIRWEKEMVRNWAEEDVKINLREQGKRKVEARCENFENGEVFFLS